jgi:hypothetical protein
MEEGETPAGNRIDDNFDNNQAEGKSQTETNYNKDSKSAVASSSSPNIPDQDKNKAESSMVQSEIVVEGVQPIAMEVMEENASESSESDTENEDHFVRRSTRDPSLSMLERADVKKLVSSL